MLLVLTIKADMERDADLVFSDALIVMKSLFCNAACLL